MPQIFQVLRCYKCSIFQVHQTKKSNKFQCKVCGEKQSIKRHYGLGTAKDCRLHVQKLNGIRGDIEESKIDHISSSAEDSQEEYAPIKSLGNNFNKGKESKWSHYIEKEKKEQESNDEEEMRLNDVKVVLDVPKKLKRVNNTSRFSKSKRGNFGSTYSNRNIIEGNTGDNTHGNVATILCNPPSPPSESKLNFKPILNKDENESKHIPKSKLVPVAVSKNSKWAQFTEENENEEHFSIERDCTRKHDDSKENVENITQKDIKNSQFYEESKSKEMSSNKIWFSQCDDSELDDLLDF